MKKLYITIICLLSTLQIIAQDAHFSQSELNAQMRNPATIGQTPYDNVLSASYRSQWAAIPEAYRNISLAFDQKVSNISWGLGLLHNDAGDRSMRTSQILFNLSYQKPLSEEGEVLAIGATGGLIQQRFKPELFTFDNQYVQGEGFDTNLSNGENFTKTTQMLPTVTIGAMATKYLNNIKATVGISFAHLNEPNAQFFDNSLEKYPMRTSAFAKLQVPMSNDLKGEIYGAINKQHVANEKMVGAKVHYQMSNRNWIHGGIGSRLGDAFVLEAGMQFPQSIVTVSYDINNSKLADVTDARGAIEISGKYFFNRNKKKRSVRPVNAKKEDVIFKEGTNDRDGDGIIDNLDECPTVPGLRHFNGCNDTDRDGVWDSKDACPHLYGEKSNQGCPTNSIDSDKDGLIDEVDNCPFLKGSAEMGGCPDSDKDGISDLEDYCPFLKGEKENNGCPNMNKKEHQEFVTTKSIRAIVEFDTDKAFIKPQFNRDLREVARFLIENPNSEAYLTGHTDDEGNSEYNYRLGESRTRSVREYLMDQGVGFHQISTISYGESKPIRANISSYEKARNRRVEVNVYLK